MDTQAKLGTYHTNPYVFLRHWDVPKTKKDQQEKPSETVDMFNRLIDEKFSKFDNKFERFERNFEKLLKKKKLLESSEEEDEDVPLASKFKGKGKGKSSTGHSAESVKSHSNKSASPPQSTSSSKIRKAKVVNYLKDQKKRQRPLDSSTGEEFFSTRSKWPNSDQSSCSDFSETEVSQDSTKRIFLERLECLLNNDPIDQVNIKATAFDDMEMFWRMYYFNGQYNSLFSCGISYKEFLSGNYCAIFDLSCSGRGAASTFMVPSIRTGHLKLR